jgi:hypothetical protein
VLLQTGCRTHCEIRKFWTSCGGSNAVKRCVGVWV